MTVAVTEVRTTRPVERSLGSWLEHVHGEWMQEVLGILEAGRATDAGIWVRWGAVRYLNECFAERLERSRAAMERLRPYIAADAVARLWALGELLELLRQQLDRSVALHRTGDEFSAGAVKFLRALGCWCREVERALVPVEWNRLPGAARQEIARLGPGGGQQEKNEA